MFDFQLKRHGRLAAGVAVAAAALTLVACGGSSHNDTAAGNPQLPGGLDTLPVVTADTFIAIVKSRIAVTDEVSEPGSIDGVTATTPETTAPEPTT